VAEGRHAGRFESAELRGQENQYDVAAVVRWYAQRELARAQASSPRDELDRVKTEREKLALARDRSELVERKQLRPRSINTSTT
jgi:phage terminase Nu1 subunit (DNA packaging protein)